MANLFATSNTIGSSADFNVACILDVDTSRILGTASSRDPGQIFVCAFTRGCTQKLSGTKAVVVDLCDYLKTGDIAHGMFKASNTRFGGIFFIDSNTSQMSVRVAGTCPLLNTGNFPIAMLEHVYVYTGTHASLLSDKRYASLYSSKYGTVLSTRMVALFIDPKDYTSVFYVGRVIKGADPGDCLTVLLGSPTAPSPELVLMY